MMRRLKPFRHICSTCLTDGVGDKCDTCDWSLVDCDNACVLVYMTLCVRATNVYITNTISTHEAKTLCMTRTWLQAWHWHQHEKVVDGMIKQGGWEDSHKLMENPSACSHQVNLSIEALILDVGQNFRWCCSHYKTWQHTGRNLASPFWFIFNARPWSFEEYWIIVWVASDSPLTP